MRDVIAPKRSSLRPGLFEASMFLKLSISLIPNNPTHVEESLIWNTLIPSRHELLDDIDDDNDDDDLSLVPVESQEVNLCVDFKPFNFIVQQHENIEPTESTTTKYVLFDFVEWISLWFRMNMHVT